MKHRIILSLLIIASLGFTGCTEGLKIQTVYVPELNKSSIAEVGQSMYEKVNAIYKYEKAVELLDSKAKKDYKGYPTYFDIQNNSCNMIVYDIELVDDECDGVFDYKMDGITTFDLKKVKLNNPIKYKVIPANPTEIREDSFKYIVLYQGKIGNKLNISFQEFIYSPYTQNFLIRDAYTQNIQYELDENGEAMIGFKGLRIKVLKATNFNITYVVLKDYN